MDGIASSISVAVRIRPLSAKEQSQLSEASLVPPTLFQTEASLSAPVYSLRGGLRKIIKVFDDRVLVFDPQSPLTNANKQLLGAAFNTKKVKDIRFCFDRVYPEDATQEDVYDGSARRLVDSVLKGFNATCFAYGATGTGKTHTISGSPTQPGIIFSMLKDLFERIHAQSDEKIVELTISYLEIYNETIKDLICPGSPLALREASPTRVVIPNLSEHQPKSAEEVITLIHQANQNRTTNFTEANAVSSRSHAVLSVNIKSRAKTANISEEYQLSTLSIIDLAGSERASVTRNQGARLHEGANINRSLLALGNCINALCDPRTRGHVPYRDSKLTRLLKHSLGGNCQTSMIVCVSPSSQHYDETHNTLQYANRAKEIKTKVTRNIISVDRHVSQYVKIIFELRQELEQRKKDDAMKEERAKLEERSLRNKGLAEVKEGLKKLQHTHQDILEKSHRAGLAKAQLEELQKLQPVLGTWLSSTGLDQAYSTEASMNRNQAHRHVQDLTTQLLSHASSLQTEAITADNSKSILSASLAALKRKLTHPDAMAVFEREAYVLELETKVTEAKAREAGRSEASRHLTSILATVANVQLLLAGEDEAFQQHVQLASSKVYEALSSTTLPSFQVSPIKKGFLAVPLTTPGVVRPSPRKALRSASRLKSSFMSPRKKAASKTEVGVKKSVIWKDEIADGWEVESNATDTDADLDCAQPEAKAKVVVKATPPFTSLPVTFARSTVSSAFQSRPGRSTPAQDVKENTPPISTAPKSSNRMSAGFLGRKKLPLGTSHLSSVNEEALSPRLSNLKIASTSTTDSSFSSSTNSSFCDTTIVSSAKPRVNPSRRISNQSSKRRSSIGPVRSERKKSRRSYLDDDSRINDASVRAGSPSTVEPVRKSRPLAGRASVLSGRVSQATMPVWR